MSARRRARVALGAIALVAAACGIVSAPDTQIHARSETMPWADVSAYRTYRWWLPPLVDSRRGYDEREAKIDWRVRQSVDAELAARGYTVDTAGTPDFVVKYVVSVDQSYTSSFQDYAAYRAEGGSKGMGEAFMGYDRGALMVELIDVPSRRVAWRAGASAIVESGGGEAKIDPAVRQMFAQFPGQAR